jgi:hypothetical protein
MRASIDYERRPSQGGRPGVRSEGRHADRPGIGDRGRMVDAVALSAGATGAGRLNASGRVQQRFGSRCGGNLFVAPHLAPSQRPRRMTRTPTEWNLAMLWTILVILAIIALALFIFSRVRGGRGV